MECFQLKYFAGARQNTLVAMVVLMMVVLMTSSAAAPAEINPGAFMLSVNSLDSTLAIYRLGAHGVVRQQGFYPTAKNPKAVAVHPNGKFAYVVAKTGKSIICYEIFYAGERLELQNPRAYTVPALSPFSLVIHPTGRFLYVAAREGKIAAYRVNPKSGLLTPLITSPIAAQYRTRSLIIHRTGRFLYAVNAYANSICAYGIDTESGALTPLAGSPFRVMKDDVVIRSLWPLADVPAGAGGIPYAVVSEPQGRYLYVSNWGAGKISGFSIDQATGVLRELADSPFAIGLNPYALAVHPSGKYLYAGSWQTDSLWAYQIDPQTGALQLLPQQSFPTGGNAPVSIVFNPAGTMAYVANAESASISTFQVARDSGELTLLHSTQTRPGPWWLTEPVPVDQGTSATHLYTVNKTTRQLSLWTVNLQKPSDVQLVDSVALPGAELWAVQKGLNAVYAADPQAKSISAYALDKTTRRFVKVAGSPWTLPGTLVDFKIDANGWYLYALTREPELLLAFGIDSQTASLIPVSQPVRLQFAPEELLLDPAGRYAYVISADRRRVSLFSYRHNTGPLLHERIRFGSPFALSANTSPAMIDAGANFMLLIQPQNQSRKKAVAAYQINALSGALTEARGSPVAVDAHITRLAMASNSNLVYGLDDAACQVLAYSRDARTGAMNKDHPASLELGDCAITAIIAHGGLVYLADTLSKSILVYALNEESTRFQRIAQVKLAIEVDSFAVAHID